MPSLSNSYTLSQFIALGDKVSITYGKYSTTETIDDIIFPVYHVVDDYITEIKRATKTVDLNKEQYYKYRYRPKLLSYDVYGSTELDFIILAVNGIADMKEFDFRTLQLLTKSDLVDIMSYIYNAEYNFINSNKN